MARYNTNTSKNAPRTPVRTVSPYDAGDLNDLRPAVVVDADDLAHMANLALAAHPGILPTEYEMVMRVRDKAYEAKIRAHCAEDLSAVLADDTETADSMRCQQCGELYQDGDTRGVCAECFADAMTGGEG